MIDSFKAHLEQNNMARNTIAAYSHAVSAFLAQHRTMTKKNLLAHKAHLIDTLKPATVNQHIQALNKYLDFVGRGSLRLKPVKVQQRTFLENVISNADYRFLASRLRADGHAMWYFVVRFLAATGARASELIQLKAEHVVAGHFDIYSKGGKVRRLYIPRALRDEAMAWLTRRACATGYLFVNRHGTRITTRGIALQLKSFAMRYGLNPAVVYPHSFRHLFAKNFLERFNDIALLADLMGHESIETTRIYLRRTAGEQRAIVDQVITW